jgi:hypothetical protein
MYCIVDFDGTFFKNDFFSEIFFKFIIERPFYLLKLFFIKNFNFLEIKKTLLANHKINYDVDFLINSNVLKWINENKSNFINIYLVSASPDFFIKYILKDQIIFDDLFGSISINLKGVEKVKFIQQKWGSNFVYLGDSNDDIPIFKIAKKAYRIKNNILINVTSLYKID